MVLSMPPFDIFPSVWVCLPALIFLLQGTQNYKQAFFTGWAFAFGYFVFGLYWIASAMFVDIGRFWWAIPFSVAGLPAFFAVYYGLAAAIARKTGLTGLRGAVNFGLLWFLAEVARGTLFTGFPWILLGYAWSGVLPVLQITSLVGIYGLTLMTIVAACTFAVSGSSIKTGRLVFLGSLVFFAAIAGWGEYRLQTTNPGTESGVRVRLVQPNVDQKTKWAPSERERHFQDLISLSSVEGEKPVTHIFWPETAATYYLGEDAIRRKEIAANIPSAAAVITGVIRRDLDKEGNTHFYNSLVALDGLGRLVAGYDKVHLVPFGEFMPLRRYIPIQALATSGADFTPGAHIRTLRVLGLPLFSPLICYEVIFPGKVVDERDRPDFMVNLTNDGWYGQTTGPYQHFAIARVRSIEEGLPLLRIANTGISGVIDALGRVEERLGINKQGVIDSELPKPLSPTFYAEKKETFVWIAFFLLLVINAKGLKKLREIKL